MGTGLRRPLDGWRAGAVEQLNAAGIESVAIDLPSGLGADALDIKGSVMRARHTLTFQLPKTALLFRETGQAAGRIHVLDIGLHPDFQVQTELAWHWTSQAQLKTLWRPRSTFEHKGTRGHLLLAAGSKGMMGAAVLAARAALRSGCGLLTVHAPSSGRSVLQTSVPEALFSADIHAEKITRIKGLEGRNVWAIGPGIGTDKQTQQWLIQTLKECLVPLVLDADALNLIAQHAQGAKNLVPGTIITPHPKEFDRLFGAHTSERDRLYTAQEQAKHRAIVIVLKGAFTRVVFPDGTVHFNPTGNPGLASGGTGDVLTGVIAALRAQSYCAEEAALLGTWIHGKAADLAAEASGITQLIASDVVAQLPRAFALLER
jgi:NAD(P)H-hydrate epimerase